MTKMKKALALLLALCCVFTMNVNMITAQADDSNYTYVTIDGNQGSFELTMGTDKQTTTYFNSGFIPGTNINYTNVKISDPVYWDTSRAFLGWLVCTWELVPNEYGDSFWQYVQVDGTGLLTTAEMMDYTIPGTDICFVAEWAGEDSDYYSHVFINGYGQSFKFNDIIYDGDGQYHTNEQTTEGWGNDLKEGYSIKEQTADYFEFIQEPVKEGATLEGWAVFKVDMSDNNFSFEDYTLVDNTIYTTEQMLNRPVPEDDIAYVAKWSDIPLENYFKNGFGGGDDGKYTHVEFDGNDGTFSYVMGDDKGTAMGIGTGFEPGVTVDSTNVRVEDPVFWDAGRAFLGWIVCTWGEFTDDGGNTYWDRVQIEGTKLMTTAEAMAYVVPDYDICFVAQWAGEDSDYYSHVFIEGYGQSFKFNEIIYQYDEKHTREITTEGWGNDLREGFSISEQTSDYFELTQEPTKEGATLEGWVEFKVDMTDNNFTPEDYTLVDGTIYTTEQMLNRPVPEDNIAYVAKWSDIPLEDYYKHDSAEDTPKGGLVLEDGKWIYTVNGEKDTTKVGLVPYENAWFYVDKGEVDTTKTGFVDYDGATFYVARGQIVGDANGLVAYDGEWYFAANGQVQKQHSGLAAYDGQWFYIEEGKLDTSVSGFVEYDGAKFYVGAGRIMSEVNGLAQDRATGDWYFLARGQVQEPYTGLASYDGAWFYIISGKLAMDYTGEVEHDGAMFKVVKGRVVFE